MLTLFGSAMVKGSDTNQCVMVKTKVIIIIRREVCENKQKRCFTPKKTVQSDDKIPATNEQLSTEYCSKGSAGDWGCNIANHRCLNLAGQFYSCINSSR